MLQLWEVQILRAALFYLVLNRTSSITTSQDYKVQDRQYYCSRKAWHSSCILLLHLSSGERAIDFWTLLHLKLFSEDTVVKNSGELENCSQCSPEEMLKSYLEPAG